MYQYGNIQLHTMSGTESPPCQICGVTHATMYKIVAIKKDKSQMPLTLCVSCNSNLANMFKEFTESFNGY